MEQLIVPTLGAATLQALLLNIRLACKNSDRTNSLAYFATESATLKNVLFIGMYYKIFLRLYFKLACLSLKIPATLV